MSFERCNERSLEDYILEAAGEVAVAKALNIPYDPLGRGYGSPGVPIDGFGILQVRTTADEHCCLILRPDDSDDKLFILVLAHEWPKLYICGWLYGREGKQQQWWGERQPGQPAYYVPQGELRSMKTLRDEIENRRRKTNKVRSIGEAN